MDVLISLIGVIALGKAGGDALEPFEECDPVGFLQNARFHQCLGPDPAPADILRPEANVHIKAPVQGNHRPRHGALNATAPEGGCRADQPAGVLRPTDSIISATASSVFFCPPLPPSRSAATRAGSPNNLMNPSASAWS